MLASTPVSSTLDRQTAIRGLKQIHAEWQEAAAGKPLDQALGSVGLLLADVAEAIGLTERELVSIFGFAQEQLP